MGYKRRREFRHIILEMLDLLIVVLSFYASVPVFNLFFNKALTYGDIQEIVPIVVIVSVFFFEIFGVFYNDNTYLDNMLDVVLANVLSILLVAVVAFAFNMGDFATKIFPIALGIESVVFAVYKWIWYRIKTASVYTLKYVFIGDEAEYDRLKFMSQEGINRYEVADRLAMFSESKIGFLLGFDGVVVGSSVGEAEKMKIIDLCLAQKLDVYFIPGFLEIIVNQSKLIKINQTPLFHLNHYRMTSEEAMLKRMFDVLISAIMIVVMTPLMLLVAICVKLQDFGPVIFEQERVTADGKVFRLLKFRTMVVDAEENTGPVVAGKKDERVTRMGTFFRKTRLDELPQLFNILSGSMSLVGPRPERPEFTNKYEQQISHYKQRFTVKAGLTGLAQVLGDYDMPTEDKLKFDLMYISNYSVMLDVYILMKTVQVIVGRRGV